MGTRIFLEQSALWLIPIALLAFIISWWMYRRENFPAGQKWLLGSFRFIILFILGLLLLSPFLQKTTLEDEKPLLIWLEDRSTSMLAADSTQTLELAQNVIPEALSELDKKYRIIRYGFDSDLQIADSLVFQGENTDIQQALGEALDRHYNENIAAITIWSDGIYNLGSNPLYQAEASGIPIYTIGNGDTTIVRDLLIADISHNRISFLNNEFQLDISIRARQLKDHSFQLKVTNQDKELIYSKSHHIESNDYFKRFEVFLKASKVGLQTFTISAGPLADEAGTANNYRTFSIEVIDNRKKILIWGSAPHPDIAAISRAASGLQRYEVITAIGSELPGEADADIRILHSPDQKMIRSLENNKIPYAIINGSTAGSSYYNLSGVQLRANQQAEEVFPAYNTTFNLFDPDEKLQEFSNKLPPLSLPFGRIEFPADANVLFYKQIGKVRSSEPLWLFQERDGRRSTHILGSGLWRWRIYNYRYNSDFLLFDNLIAGMLQYLTARNEDVRFIVENAGKFSNNEEVDFTARLYNKALELTNEPRVNLTIVSDKGEDYNFEMNRSGSIYRLNTGKLPPGIYNYTAVTKIGEEEFKRQGAFIVQKPEAESTDLLARHDLLRQISSTSGGSFYTEENIMAMVQDLAKREDISKIQVQKKDIRPLLDEKWLFFIMLIFMAAEWALRKYFGKY